MKSHLKLSIGLVSCLALLGGISQADPQFEATAIIGSDLIKEPIQLKGIWASGVLRVLITGPGAPSSWNIKLDYGDKGVLQLNGDALVARTVRQGPEGVIVDLPIPGTGTLSASSSISGVRVRPINVLSISTIRPQQKIDGSPDVHDIDEGSSQVEKDHAMAFGRLDVLDAGGGILGLCTAFRIVRGYWLTAAHCIYRNNGEPTATLMARWRLQPDAYAGRLEGNVFYEARPVASGLAAVNSTNASLMQPTDSDYVLLQVDKDPGGPALPLNAAQNAAPGTKLELLQHWKGDYSPAPGKAAANTCEIREHLELDDYSNSANCPFTLQHTCSSDGGGSGGALVDASNFRLIGLHYGAGKDHKFNCAVPVATIAGDLCKRYSSIGAKVISCPTLVVQPAH